MSARERMSIISAYQQVGTYRGAAVICGTTHKTVKRVIEGQDAGDPPPVREPRPANFEGVRDLVAQSVKSTSGRISAKAAAAQGPRPGVHRVGPKFPSPRRAGEEGVAPAARQGAPAGGVDAG